MSERLDIIDRSQAVGTPEPVPPQHPFNLHVVSRILTKTHGIGKPCVTPIPLAGMADLLEQGPYETVTVKNEKGVLIDQVIDYTTGAVTGGHLVANTAPERVLAIMRPAASDDPHEPGLVVRLGYEIEGLNAARLALTSGATVPSDAVDALGREEQRTRAWLEVAANLEKKLFLS